MRKLQIFYFYLSLFISFKTLICQNIFSILLLNFLFEWIDSDKEKEEENLSHTQSVLLNKKNRSIV